MTRTITFRCPAPVHDALRAISYAERVSIQRLFEQAVGEFLARRHVAAHPGPDAEPTMPLAEFGHATEDVAQQPLAVAAE